MSLLALFFRVAAVTKVCNSAVAQGGASLLDDTAKDIPESPERRLVQVAGFEYHTSETCDGNGIQLTIVGTNLDMSQCQTIRWSSGVQHMKIVCQDDGGATQMDYNNPECSGVGTETFMYTAEGYQALITHQCVPFMGVPKVRAVKITEGSTVEFPKCSTGGSTVLLMILLLLVCLCCIGGGIAVYFLSAKGNVTTEEAEEDVE
jgi:hypothetical protein|mmetsp:Transcript_40177/g.63788  ORF Transcript_40177/g.63788 Transcript_40177/m.63788 type:complete len:204 (-) Transcript_40177:359-970(-)|eukprot:CAMPEP_0169082918 /NCGR_PEP_ID=MMETSP1015-20121227/11799_1 /TAXON_ID=342587 /ORGANISM="Karlodinium micrum, Strain CCMP2283" /LENGTH=203 /DNA_ID=CAMNT_0009142803 /DNA_START=54 /DNA_END=665 /DNA_ORIENTATION=+